MNASLCLWTVWLVLFLGVRGISTISPQCWPGGCWVSLELPGWDTCPTCCPSLSLGKEVWPVTPPREDAWFPLDFTPFAFLLTDFALCQNIARNDSLSRASYGMLLGDCSSWGAPGPVWLSHLWKLFKFRSKWSLHIALVDTTSQLLFCFLVVTNKLRVNWIGLLIQGRVRLHSHVGSNLGLNFWQVTWLPCPLASPYLRWHKIPPYLEGLRWGFVSVIHERKLLHVCKLCWPLSR